MLDLLTIGRISVDLYGQEEGHGLSDPQTFQKSVCIREGIAIGGNLKA
jgi:hypothetical protein